MMSALLLVLGLCVGHAQDVGDEPVDTVAALEMAYQKEFAYLKAEEQTLRARQREQQLDAAQRIQRGEANISGLQARLLALQRQGNDVEDRLVDVEDAAIAEAEAQDLIQSTVHQAGEALGVEITEDASNAAKLQAVFDAALAGLASDASVRTDEGVFFTADGTQVSGQRVFIGQVAAYGVSEQGAGSLLPIGDGHLQLRAAGSGSTDAAALLAGQLPAHLDVFLFESLDKPIAERAEQTLSDVMEGGGVVGWVIVMLGAIALLLSGVRMVILTLSSRGMPVVEQVAQRLAARDMSGAQQLVAPKNSPVARVVSAIVQAPNPDRETLQDIASEALLQELPAIERFGALIIMVAAVAPLLGLLGTVTGMIATFEIITEFGTGDPKMLSGGISEALITTQLGLVVAIPAVLLGNILKGRAEAVVATIERAALHVVNLRAGEDMASSMQLQSGPHGLA